MTLYLDPTLKLSELFIAIPTGSQLIYRNWKLVLEKIEPREKTKNTQVPSC